MYALPQLEDRLLQPGVILHLFLLSEVTAFILRSSLSPPSPSRQHLGLSTGVILTANQRFPVSPVQENSTGATLCLGHRSQGP